MNRSSLKRKILSLEKENQRLKKEKTSLIKRLARWSRITEELFGLEGRMKLK